MYTPERINYFIIIIIIIITICYTWLVLTCTGLPMKSVMTLTVNHFSRLWITLQLESTKTIKRGSRQTDRAMQCSACQPSNEYLKYPAMCANLSCTACIRVFR